MVEPLFRFDGEAFVGQELILDGPEGHHAASVRRMRVGEAIQLTDGKANHLRGVVAEVAPKSLVIKVTEASRVEQPALSFGLVQALAKGDRDELAIQAATELGVVSVTPWQAERSISRWDSAKAAKGVARWQQITDEAAKQALRPLFPVVQPPKTSKEVAALASEATLVVLDPTAESALIDLPLPEVGRIEIVVGPEGGISEQELQMLDQAGAKRVHMGSGILRTSTAGVAAIAYLAGRQGLWR